MPGFTINRVFLSGNLTRDPEMRSLPSGATVCEIGLAVNERIKNQHTGDWDDRANFFDISIWGGIGEWAARNLSKGSGVTIEGRLRYEAWEKDGQKRSKVKIVADSIVPREVGGGQAPRSDVTREEDFGAPVGAGGFGGGSTADPDDIPF